MAKIRLTFIFDKRSSGPWRRNVHPLVRKAKSRYALTVPQGRRFSGVRTPARFCPLRPVEASDSLAGSSDEVLSAVCAAHMRRKIAPSCILSRCRGSPGNHPSDAHHAHLLKAAAQSSPGLSCLTRPATSLSKMRLGLLEAASFPVARPDRRCPFPRAPCGGAPPPRSTSPIGRNRFRARSLRLRGRRRTARRISPRTRAAHRRAPNPPRCRRRPAHA